MINLFVCLVANLKNHGKITAATMYDDALSQITIVDGDTTYDVCITKRKNEGNIKNA